MPQQEYRQPRVALLCDPDQSGDVGHVLRHVLDVVALAIGLAASAQIDRKDREPALGHPL
jgi:hypothetical protein